MDPAELEAAALKLAPGERARLAQKLLASLETLSDAENARLWEEEAERRNAELDDDPSTARPGPDVLREARARIR